MRKKIQLETSRQTQSTPAEASGGAEYIVVRQRGLGRAPARFSLPVLIGSSGECDIVVNTAALAPKAKVLLSKNSELYVHHLHTGDVQLADSLTHLGLNVSGPFSGEAPTQDSLSVRALESLKLLDNAYNRLPPKVRLWTGGRLPMQARFGVWSAVFVLAASLVLSLTIGRDVKPVDQSKRPIALAFGSLLTDGIGATPSYRAYEQGFTLGVSFPAGMPTGDLQLAFDAKGLDQFEEIAVRIGDRQIFASAAGKTCAFQFCPITVVIPAGLLDSENPSIFFAHQPFSSHYVVKNILLETVKPLTPGELISIQRSYDRASRAFEERGITHANLIIARGEIKRVQDSLRTRVGAEDLRARSEALAAEIEEQVQAMREEVLFRARKEQQLGRFKAARDLTETLLAFYPDPKSKEHQEIAGELAALEEFAK